jgi:hypothetical protein
MIKQESKVNTDIVGLRGSLQKLSFDQLLEELGTMKLKLGVIIPIIFEKGKRNGLSEIEIRDMIRKTIDIPERTLNPYLPEGAKRHKYPKNRELASSANYNTNTENSTSTKSVAKSFGVLNDNTKFHVEKTYGKSDSEPVLHIANKSAHTSSVYGNWTLDELIFRYEEIELENEYLALQLADANTRIEELEECLEEQGLMVYG